MNRAKQLQKEHEKYVCDRLLAVLELRADFIRYGDDTTEPDVLYKLDEKVLGIEVASAYYDDSDAKQTWTLARGEREFPSAGYEFRAGGPIWSPDDVMAERIQSELEDKCVKSYSGVDLAWLCIEERAQLSDDAAVKHYFSKIVVPENKFDQIYLLHLSPMHEQNKYVAYLIDKKT